MALHRSVLMGDGVVRRYHVISSIQHLIDKCTTVEVVSTMYEDSRETAAHTLFNLDYDDTLTADKAYEFLEKQPEFKEVVDEAGDKILDLQSVVSDLVTEKESLSTALAQTEQQLLDADENLSVSQANLSQVLTTLTDDQALIFSDLYPHWNCNIEYTQNVRVFYNNALYKCVQTHTSQADWTPNVTPALWAKVALPGVIDGWVQPTGSHDAYMLGDKVTYNGATWESIVDNNVWSPDVYGWNVIDEIS